jgi:hypothetical protein
MELTRPLCAEGLWIGGWETVKRLRLRGSFRQAVASNGISHAPTPPIAAQKISP